MQTGYKGPGFYYRLSGGFPIGNLGMYCLYITPHEHEHGLKCRYYSNFSGRMATVNLTTRGVIKTFIRACEEGYELSS